MNLIDLQAITEADVKSFIDYWFPGAASILGLVIAGEILIRALAWWVSRDTDQQPALVSRDAPANFVLSLISRTMDGLIGGATIYGAAVIGSHLSHWHIPFNGYTIPLYFLAAELYHYLYHRLGHEVRLFWADHSIHHSSRDYEFFTSWRVTPTGWIYKAMTMLPIAMLGFGPVGLFLMARGITFQTFIHTQRIGSMGWFDKVFCSPVNHAIHHACNPLYIDRNYGGMTMIWDRILGTFILPEGEKIKFGITKDLHTHDPLKIMIFEFRHMVMDAVAAPGFAEALKVLWGRPGETFSRDLAKLPVVSGDPALIAAE